MSPKSTSVKATQRKVKAIPVDHNSDTVLYGRMTDASHFGFRAGCIRESIQQGKAYKGFYWRYAG